LGSAFQAAAHSPNARSATCSSRAPHNKAKEIHYQQKGDQLVLSLEGASRSLPWKAVRTPASEDPIACEDGPCPVAFDLRLKEGVLLVISPAALFTEAVILDRKNRTATFNAACAYARLGNAAQAVSFLEALPDAAEARKKARSDKDFDGIRTSPELQKFLGAAAD
jgi:hypothetical protein